MMKKRYIRLLAFLLLAQAQFTTTIQAQNSSVPVYDTASFIDEVFFLIKNVNRISEDSAYVTIDYGKQDGVFLGATGNIMSSHGASTGKNRESTIYLGTAKIVKLDDRSAMAAIKMYNKYKAEPIYPEDLLSIQVHPVVNMNKNIFSYLAIQDVLFVDNAREPIKTKREILRNTNPDLEKTMLEAYTKEITDFATELASYSDITFKTAYKEGPYKGKTMVDVFKNATVYDLNAFFHFVKSFPGKYMGGFEGKSWKINETFATWVLNNAPQGNHNREWLLPYIEEKPLLSLSDLVKKNSYFIQADSLAEWTSRVSDLQTAGQLEAATSLCDKLIFIAKQLNDSKAEYEFYYNRSFLLEAGGRSAEALAEIQKVFAHDPSNINYKYALANQYGKMEKFQQCFQLYEELKKELPGNVNILGNYGWYKLTAGQVDEAIPLCRQAYYGDSSSVAFTVNYGHTFLLKNNLDSAMYYYDRTMNNLYHPADYTDGPKTDFVLFFKKGWERKNAATAVDWMDKEFKEKYYPITRGNEIWDEAKALYNDKSYQKAADKWKEYIAVYKEAKDTPYLYIHNANNWIGSSYWSAKMYDSAVKYYDKSLVIAKDHLIELRNEKSTKDNDVLVVDYERLYNFYNEQKRTQKADEYKILLDAEAQKVTELYANPALHVIALGGDNSNTYKESANAFFNTFTGLKKQEKAFTRLLNGGSLTKEKLVSLLEEIRVTSKPEDIFVFYYAGENMNEGNQSFINFNAKDAAHGKISITELMDYIDLIYANKKMVISDLPNPALLSLITSRYVNASNSGSEIIFLSPGVPTPVQEGNVSLFTNELIATANKLQETGSFSAKDFTDKAAYAIGRGQHYLPVLSFAYGKDFLLFENKSLRGDVGDDAVATRGLKKNENKNDDADVAISGPQKNYALLFATDEYKDNEFNRLVNPINDAKALQNILQNDFGFEVKLVINPTRDEMELWLSEYRDNKRYGPNDQLLIFFAGHGVYYDNAKMGYLVAKDSKMQDPTHKTYLSYSDLGNIYLKNINCNRIFLVLDACFAGSFFDNNGLRGNPKEIDARNLTYLKRTSSNQRFYKGISSGGKQYVADGKPGQHSPFAGSFMRVLYNKALQKNFVTADEIIGEIKSNPPAATAICEGNFNYSDPLSHFIFELKAAEKVSDIKTANLK
ncbi:MAG TPA: caspase family protein [Chitinophagaceae bacterium]|nr:caspase family protein [Chitinophagaceae bacterium]